MLSSFPVYRRAKSSWSNSRWCNWRHRIYCDYRFTCLLSMVPSQRNW